MTPTPKYTITNGQDLIPRESITALIYGDSGTGKTQFAGTFGSVENDKYIAGDRTLYLNIGAGINTLYAPKFTSMYGKWNGLRITELENMENIVGSDKKFDYLTDLLDAVDPSTYDTIVLDDSTALREMAANKALVINGETGKSQSITQAKKYQMPYSVVQDMGQEMDIMKWFFSTCTQAAKANNKNLIVLAHTRREYGKVPSVGQPAPIISIKPGFTGKDNKLSATFDYVWYFTFEAGKYVAKTVGDDLIEAKTRDGGIFPQKFYNPNYPIIKRALDIYHNTGKVPDLSFFPK